MPFDPTTAAPVDEFDPSTAQEFSPETATPIDEPKKERGFIDTAKTTLDLAGQLPAIGREVLQATAVDVVDMVLGIPSLIAKTLETGFLAGAGAIRGDEDNLKNVAGFMAEESAKPSYAASQAPLRTITDLAGNPLPQSPIGVGLEKAMGVVEQRGEEVAEATGVEGIKYATPMLMEGGMSMLVAHATAKGQARQKANKARAAKIQEAKAAGLTTNEMAEAVLKKAAEKGINTEGITKPVIKATLDDIAEYYGTKVVEKGQPPVSELAGLNKTMQHLDTRKTPRVQTTLIVEPKPIAQLDPARLVNALDKNRRIEPKQAGAVDALKESIAKNGVVRPITVTVSTKDGMAYVTDGNTRTLAAFEAGEKTVPVRIEKTDVPFTKEQKAKAKPINDLGITEDMIPDRKLTPQQLADKKELQALLRKETTTPDNVSKAADVLAEQSYNKTVLQELPAGMRKAAELMLERQKKGLRGGLVIGPMPKLRQQLHKDARKFVPVDFLEELQKEIPASADDSWGAFYHPVTGNIYFNTLTIKNPKDVAARFLHEVSHAADNPKLNAEIMKRLADPSTFEGNLANLPPELAYYEARGLYSRVRARMQYAGERDVPTEATAYFITETMRMGRQAGFSRLDTGFWQWATKALPPEALGWLKQIVAKIRATMYRYGVELKESDLTPDDIVALTEANAKRIGEGKQETVFGTDAGADKGMQASAIKEGNEVGLVPRLTGTHYSPTQRPVLKGGMYGTGVKGAERARLAKAEDPRIKTRVSFYVDEGKGVFPEQGVGNYRHDVPLDNLYDAAKNPQKLPAEDLNKFESAVLDAGFDGYYVKEAFDRQGAAVVLGDAAKEIWVPESTSISLADFKPENVSNILKKDNWTILTAENPMGKQLTPKENTLRMNALHAELKAMGIHYKEAEGFYGGNKEHSVVIFDIGKEQALEIGKRFDQDSVLIKDGLLYHDGTIAPATGIKTKDLTPDDGLTHIPATGATFAVGIDFNKRVPAGLRRADEATFQEQRLHAPKPTEAEIDAAIKSGQAEIAAIDEVMARSALALADVQRFVGPKKQRGAIGYLYAPTLEEAIKIADARNGMVGKQVNRGWKVEVPMSIEEAAKLPPEDVINWALSPEDLAKRDFFKKQRGAIGEQPTRGQQSLQDWFGASVVTTTQGKPQVVYHGTKASFDSYGVRPDSRNVFTQFTDWLVEKGVITQPTEYASGLAKELGFGQSSWQGVERLYGKAIPRIDQMDKGAIWTTTSPELAAEYASAAREGAASPNIRPEYIRIEHPVVVDFYKGLLELPNGEIHAGLLDDLSGHWTEANRIGLAFARKHNADGVIIRGVKDSPLPRARGASLYNPIKPQDVYIVFEPEQVRSVFTPEQPVMLNFFKKQQGKVDTKLLITSGIVLGGATLGAMLVPDEDTTQGLLMGAALGFAGVNLPKATKAISANWKKSIKTAAVGTTYATIGALVDKDNPVEGILVGSALFGTRFLPKAKTHPEDALIHARNGNIAAEKRLTAMTAQAMRDAIPDKLQREQISVLMENPAFQGRTPQERLVVNAWRGLAQSYHDIAMNENIKMGFIEGYVSHIIERGALPQLEVQRVMGELFGKGGAGVGGRARFTKGRELKYTPEQIAAALKETRQEMIQARKEAGQQLRIYIKDNKANLAPYEIAQMWQEHRDTFSKAARDTYLNTKLNELKSERMYPTFESLEKALEGTSLKLKTKDIADITQIYADTMNRTIENQRLINNLKDATLGDVNGLNARLLTADMQPSYVKMSHPQLQAYYIHPDVAPSLKFIFDARDHAELTNGLVALNRATKRINVLGSFFHAKSLLEAYALAGGNLFTAKGAIEASLKQFREGGLGDELDLGMRAGLRVELPTEVSQQALVQIGQLADMYVGRLLGKKIGVGEKALGGLERLQERTFDKFTWDYLHTGLKTATYLRLMEDYKLGKKGQGVDIDTYRQGAASHINDTFGGLDWYRVMSEAKTEAGRKILQGTISPSGRDLLGVAIFAPDWTLSTVRAMTKALPGGSTNPANAQLARQYAARTAVLYASVLVPMNYALSGHFPWDNNDPTRLDLGDGTNLQVVKHSMEFAEWVRDPWKTFGNKMGFFPRTFEALRYGVQYPTGPEIEGSRLGYVAQQIAPFSARSFQGHLEPEVSAARSLLGAMGISVYGMTEEEKAAAKEQRAFNKMMETPEMKKPKMR